MLNNTHIVVNFASSLLCVG